MSWFGALTHALLGGPMDDGAEDFRENGFAAYKRAWLNSQATGDRSDRVLTEQLDKFTTFKSPDGTADYPEVLLEAWRACLTPASAQKLLKTY